ncbi:tetratricopeptide repeat protein [Aurantivibrio infirmus]
MTQYSVFLRVYAFVRIFIFMACSASLSVAQTTQSYIEEKNESAPIVELTLSQEEEKLLLDTQLAILDLRFQDALEKATSLLKTQARHIETNRLLGIAIANTQSTQAGLKQLDHALSLNEDDAETHYALGVMHLRRAQEVSLLRIRRSIKQSKEHLEKTLALNPDHISARFYLIQILINTPELAGGDNQLARTIQQPFATHSPLHYKIIDSEFAILEGNYALAENLLLEAQQSAAFIPAINSKLADFYLIIENYSQAIVYANKFLALKRKWDESNNVNIYQVLAKSHLGLGEIENSIANYKLAMENTTNKKLIRQIEKEIKSLSGDDEPQVVEDQSEDSEDQ